MKPNILYRLCRRYLNRKNGENNGNMFTNGECRWLREVLPICTTVFDVDAYVGEWATFSLSINPWIAHILEKLCPVPPPLLRPNSLNPCLHDRYADAGSTKVSIFGKLMVARWIHPDNPTRHVDVGSRIDGFVAHVWSFRAMEAFDVRSVSS